MSFLFSKIKEQYSSKLPFVCYCKPNSDKIIAFFQKNDDLISLEDSNTGFAFVSFDNKKRYIIPENLSDIYFEKVSNLDYVFPSLNSSDSNENEKIAFESLVKKGVEAIQDGLFEKVVLSRKETMQIDSLDVELIFNRLLLCYPTVFKYCFYHPKIGFWAGATPEQFIKVELNLLNTVALAGTQLFNNNNQEVVWQDKEIEEQQIVTDFIVENLKLHSTEVTFSKPYSIQAGNLLHIKTDIQAIVDNDSSISEIINLLHPTPAVCGFPKEQARRFILENEKYDREYYTGFLGEWNKDFVTYKLNQSDLFVNLRCMKIEEYFANLFIGCGITKDSNPEKEFEETVNKSLTIKKVLYF